VRKDNANDKWILLSIRANDQVVVASLATLATNKWFGANLYGMGTNATSKSSVYQEGQPHIEEPNICSNPCLTCV